MKIPVSGGDVAEDVRDTEAKRRSPVATREQTNDSRTESKRAAIFEKWRPASTRDSTQAPLPRITRRRCAATIAASRAYFAGLKAAIRDAASGDKIMPFPLAPPHAK